MSQVSGSRTGFTRYFRQFSIYVFLLLIYYRLYSHQYLAYIAMKNNQDNLFFFDAEEDEKQVIPPPKNQNSYLKDKKKKLQSSQLVNSTVSRNFFDATNEDYSYQKIQSNQQQIKQEQKQIIYEPGRRSTAKKNKKLPVLQKLQSSQKQQIPEPKYQKKLVEKQINKKQEEDQCDLIQIPLGNSEIKRSTTPFFIQNTIQEQASNKYVETFQQRREQQVKKGDNVPLDRDSHNSGDQNLPTHNEQEVREENIFSPKKVITFSEIPDRKVFLVNPIPKGMILQCTVKRDKSGFGMFFPHYDMYISEGCKYLMSGKRKAGNTTSNYVISSDKNDMQSKGPNFMGKVRSNFIGTEFHVFDNGFNPERIEIGRKPRRTLAELYYESNIFGAKGPRKMTIYMPNCEKMPLQHHNLKQLKQKKPNQVKILVNKPPKWNEQMRAYVLNFGGRVDKPSVKNFILVQPEKDEPNILLFGRVGEDTFNLDIEYPLSPLQAFGIVLTSFDYKIACE